MSAVRPIILDTDIGSDVDDAMALALILGGADLDLVGVTTVYGDTLLRARLAQRYAGLAGRAIRVHVGRSEPQSGREVWWAGHEGSLHVDLENERVEPEDAVSFLTRTVAADPGQVDIVAIGPLTNIAAALDTDAAFEKTVRGLWIMGGSFGTDEPEHNFRSDSTAADRVFGSTIQTVVSGLEITRQIHVDATQLHRLADAGPLGRALAADIDQWWKFWNESWSVPHDPVTVLTLVRPDLFELSPPGTVQIDRDQDSEGRSTFTPTPTGNVRIVRSLDAQAVAEAMIAGIINAGSA